MAGLDFNARSGSEIDLAVSARLKAARIAAGLTQSELAAAIGTTFQQVQKYESGVNRLSAGRVYSAAKALSLSVQDLFPPMDFATPSDGPGV